MKNILFFSNYELLLIKYSALSDVFLFLEHSRSILEIEYLMKNDCSQCWWSLTGPRTMLKYCKLPAQSQHNTWRKEKMAKNYDFHASQMKTKFN